MGSSSFFYNYLLIGIFVLVACAFSAVIILIAKLIAPRKPSAVKQATYECGLESQGDSWIQFRIQYYIFALLFVIFDIETVFLYPWAVAYRRLGLFAFAEMILFILILVSGLLYAWKKKALDWE